MAAIEIVQRGLDATGLRWAAGGPRDAAAARLMLALALVLEGNSRAQAAQAAGMDRQRLARLGSPLQRGRPSRTFRADGRGRPRATAFARAGG